jgi:hypothetical protein
LSNDDIKCWTIADVDKVPAIAPVNNDQNRPNDPEFGSPVEKRRREQSDGSDNRGYGRSIVNEQISDGV